jgi:hypothetical protein
VEPIHDEQGRLAGRVVREHRAVEGAIRISGARLFASHPLLAVRIRIENLTLTDAPAAPRGEMLGAFLVGTHTLLALTAGEFISLLDPPPWAEDAARACENVGTWPVLVGPPEGRRQMLSSPIILADYPEIAPESAGDLFDATEIDEILTLRTMTLTDDEKREARATDPRAAAIIDRVDGMGAAELDRLHGAIRAPRELPDAVPGRDRIEIAGVTVARGSRVRLCPGLGRADAQDMFLAGRVGRVEGVFLDLEDKRYLAVTLEGDPAAEFHRWHGRYLYFAPDEVEPLEGRP